MLDLGIKEVMVASKIKKLKFDRCRSRFWNLGIKEVMVASKIQIRPQPRPNLELKEVMLVKKQSFADWPFPKSAAAKLEKSQI